MRALLELTILTLIPTADVFQPPLPRLPMFPVSPEDESSGEANTKKLKLNIITKAI